ncbi:hypothetical protein GCM10027275_47480 [Rhabdobacter roseus]|uniref:Uncharacterized protein n=1 Tax=Rhabdobacter roseus TaxID=1655419 RepID=A0A840TR61_9BACT|nr:hypothetical protein [Rhabdobacter roseus]MBB5286371.1 hypothetical protein [Rhabdobacter roseus]
MKQTALRSFLMFLFGVCLVVGIDVSKSKRTLTLPTTLSQCAEKSVVGASTLPPGGRNERCAPSTQPKPLEQARAQVPPPLRDQYLNLPRTKAVHYAELSPQTLKTDSASSYPVAEPPPVGRGYFPQPAAGQRGT